MILQIKDLHASIDGKEILKGLTLNINNGETDVIMGPNGSGKSTLAQVLMGHPLYVVDDGEVLYKDQDLLQKEAAERAADGVFLSFQYPSEVSGVGIANFLRLIYNKRTNQKLSPAKLRPIIKEKMALLGMDESFITK